MKIGVRKSPHLELLVAGIAANGDTLTSVYDGGCDFWLCWGWPQAEQVMRDGAPAERIICVDAHPFALMAGDRSGDRILQLGNWGALARYPEASAPVLQPVDRSVADGQVLVLGQVYTAEQKRLGLVDTWHTGGYEHWVRCELSLPCAKFRKHPRIWMVENPGEVQPTLADDLRGCRAVASWNSTAAVHAQLLGYPAYPPAERHGWAHLPLDRLSGLRVSPAELRSGAYWATYRKWLEAQR